MSVLEICQLRIKDGISTDDPSVLRSLVEVRSALKSKVTDTNSRFYQCMEDPTLIYIFGVWPSKASHHNFLISSQKSQILSPQQDLLDFGWILHMPLLDIDHLPLNAPVLSLARFFIRAGVDHVEIQKIFDQARPGIVEKTKPFKMVDGWRCDAEEGTQEALVFTGWTSVNDREEYASITTLCHETEVRHMSNMEA